MQSGPRHRVRALLIGAGVVLIAAFLGWLVFRQQGHAGLDLGMGSVLGWVAQGLALLILLGGVALIARATTRTTRTDDATTGTSDTGTETDGGVVPPTGSQPPR